MIDLCVNFYWRSSIITSKNIQVSPLVLLVCINYPGFFVVETSMYYFALTMHDIISSTVGTVEDEVSNLYIHYLYFLSLKETCTLMVQ